MTERRYVRTKIAAEDSLKFSIEDLEASGFFKKEPRIKNGTIEWGNGSSMEITVITEKNFEDVNMSLLILEYEQAVDGQIRSFEQRILLENTRRRYGEYGWWFLCPICPVKDSVNWRRARILYKTGQYFGCQRCSKITWKSRRRGGLKKKFGVKILPAHLYEYETRMMPTKKYYKGKPTKKFKKFLKTREKSLDYLKAVNKRAKERDKREEVKIKKLRKKCYGW
jgi:hypothetical protein